MTVRVYRHTDTSAPTLTGQAGSLITLLDACLVNGYGNQTAAGWTKVQSETNLAAYRQGTINSVPHRFRAIVRFDDTAAQTARMIGYETMSDINTGLNPFPTDVQLSGGLYVYKSGSADAVARPWTVLATERTLYLFITNNQTSALSLAYTTTTTRPQLIMFGDFNSYFTNDKYPIAIIGNTTNTSGTGNFSAVNASYAGNTTYTTGHFLCRSYINSGGSVPFNKAINYERNGTVNTTDGPINPPIQTNRYMIGPFYIWEDFKLWASNKLSTTHQQVSRGELYGLYTFFHNIPGGMLFKDGDVFSGSQLASNLSGKTLEAKTLISAATNNNNMLIETSDTW